MLDNFTRVTDLDSLPKYITLDEFRGKIKVWKENISTSPSGRHLGTYKALFQPIDFCLDKTPIESLQYKQHAIARVHVQMLNYAIKQRHAYDRWKTIVNVLILKDPGNFKILGAGCWVLGAGCWVLGAGCWVLKIGAENWC